MSDKWQDPEAVLHSDDKTGSSVLLPFDSREQSFKLLCVSILTREVQFKPWDRWMQGERQSRMLGQTESCISGSVPSQPFLNTASQFSRESVFESLQDTITEKMLRNSITVNKYLSSGSFAVKKTLDVCLTQ